jgi:hypothetical protein
MQLAGMHGEGLLPVRLQQVLDLAKQWLQLRASEQVREGLQGLRIRGSLPLAGLRALAAPHPTGLLWVVHRLHVQHL